MISFQEYYEEKFSLNPKKWFISPEEKARIKREDDKLRSNARKNAHIYIPKLKQILKQEGYTIHKHDYSYTARKDKKLGLSPTDSSREPMNYKEPLLNIPYIKTLFTLAHEVGHVLQWDNENNTRIRFNEFYAAQSSAAKIDPYKKLDLESLHKLWYELDAWVKGMQFIPVEYKRQYKQYAYRAYQTYMTKLPKFYNGDMLVRNLLYQLNFNEHR
jgi:hypothetical protein